MRTYSDKFLNENEKLRDAVVGIEFEFYTKDISYYKTMEILNDYLYPVKVWGFRQYHSDFKPDSNNFKIEPDLSGGSNMVELVTGPLDYLDAKFYLIKIMKFIQENGYTTDKCSIHFNVSFKSEDMDLNNMNILKLILGLDEDEIYQAYPSRKNNVYAKSIKQIIPFKEYDFFNIPISVVKNNIRLPDDKYYGVNFLNITNLRKDQRVEFRYIGGKDYEKNLGQIIYFMEKFIIDVSDSIQNDFNTDDLEKLKTYLEDNIRDYKSLSKYDNFIIEFPSINIQIDKDGSYEMVSSYYYKIYQKIYDIVNSTEDIKDCIINYTTDTQAIEIVDADIKGATTIKGIELIHCNVEGIFLDCFFVGCDVTNSQLTKCKFNNSEAINSKFLNCSVESSLLINSYFMNGYLNGDMNGGVFRSGKLGPYASLDEDVKVVTDNNNFFDTKYDEVDKGDKGDVLKSYGKYAK